MKYTLMTGATGLLGAYLLRDQLAAGRRMALLVRPSKLESARQRIESILARFEDDLERPLPRPVVWEGDLTQTAAGADSATQRWIARNCVRVLHNAASLSFYHDEKTGEPERSNVDGTRHTLELCRATGIREFHHVSTAYVCGLRTGKCFESELDLGQEFGNDYERSKVQAEQLIRTADCLDVATFYRPSIIIGDSRTGYTSSYHGFYTPLKVAYTLVGETENLIIDSAPILSLLGFSGDDRKNFVPVDWVSAVMTFLLARPACLGKTYHLVPRRCVTVNTVTRVLEDALRRFHGARESHKSKKQNDWNVTLDLFHEQMSVYRSYWRDDPEFDFRHTASAAPHLPCPMVHYAMLMRMAMFALESGFGWPRPQPKLPPCDMAEKLAPMLGQRRDARAQGASRIGLQVNGRGGGQWTLFLEEGTVRAARLGLPTDDQTLLYLNSQTCQRLIDQATTVSAALENGDVHVELPPETPIPELIQNVVASFRASPTDQVENLS